MSLYAAADPRGDADEGSKTFRKDTRARRPFGQGTRAPVTPIPGAGSAERAALIALASGLLVTVAVVLLLAQIALAHAREQFEAAARQAQAAVLTKMETSVALLRGTAGLFATGRAPLAVEDFGAYVNRLALRERYPGLLGIGFAQRIQPGQEEAIAADMRRNGHAAFRVWPDGSGDLRTTISFLEPLDERNRAAIGYDMATNPVRREAMARARDGGLVAASGVVELVQEIDEQRQPGFLIYLPVYLGGGIPQGVEERRRLLVGFAYSPIRAVDFLSSAFTHEITPSVGMTVIHGASGRLLYRRGPEGGFGRFRLDTHVDVEGQPWRLEFHSSSQWLGALLVPAIVGVAGILLSALLAALIARERRSRARAQASLEAESAARADAERANRAKDEFLATLSHELRTPLHAIIGWTGLLRMPSLGEEQRRQGIDVIDRNAKAQGRLIEDLLDMNRIASGKLSLELTPVDAAAAVRDAVSSMAPRFEEKNIALQVTMPQVPCLVLADLARLMQIVSNLLSNAVKFTPSGGRVEVGLACGEGQARLAITDTGEGIAPEFMERIFLRFSQADASAARRHGGLGLGLSIAQQLVELHQGSIRARSAGTGKGATFEVTLPLVSAQAGSVAGAAAPVASEELQGLRVLAIDDDQDARSFMQTLLSSHGAQVRTAASAAEAMDALAQFRATVLLSDVGMPGMDGHDLIRAIRALPPEEGGDVAAVAITAYARETDRQAALAAGFDAHLAKPLQTEALLRTVASLVKRSRAARDTAQRA